MRSCGAYAMGSPYPIDNCVASQNNCPGTPGTLPKCSAPVYTMGGGPGTIMSYCDELPDNYIGNVALTFGVSRRSCPKGWIGAARLQLWLSKVSRLGHQQPVSVSGCTPPAVSPLRCS